MNKEKKPLILCIDDDPDILRLFKRFLASSQYDVITAKSSQKGLEIVKSIKPNLILLDVMMPVIDGYEVCSRLQSNDETAYIPVVFVTALGEEQDKIKAFSVGATAYLVKPIQKDALIHMVREHINTETRWDELHEDAKSWYEMIQPAGFVQFKEYLFNQLDLNPEKRYRYSSVSSSDIYSISKGLGTDNSHIAKLIAQFLKLPYAAHIDSQDVQLGVLPTPFCKLNHVVAVNDVTHKRAFILSNPFGWDLLDTLKRVADSPQKLKLIISSPENINILFESAPPETFKETPKIHYGSKSARPAISTVTDLSDAELKNQPIVHISNNIIHTAVYERASDIHIEPKETDTIIRFRVDGDLREMFTLRKSTAIKLISRFKVLADLDIAEKRKPQDGAFAAVLGDRTFNLRLSTTYTPYGESLVMRLLEPYTKPKDLIELGLKDNEVKTMIQMANQTAGLILIVGPTGSGKTTTIYSLLHKIDYKARSVMSVEDPVEYRIPFANQQQVNEKVGVTFESLLKTVVRQDPDVLFMGEIRDAYSAGIAMDFASTGHLTITTLHTTNATSAIFRFERLGVNRGIMADTMIGVVAQRLLKKLCAHCKEIRPISSQEKDLLLSFTDDVPHQVAHPVGCPKCNDTGYYGRQAVYEVLKFDSKISEMVRSGIPISEIRSFARKRGDHLMSTDGLEKVRDLIFPLKEVFDRVLVEDIELGKQIPRIPVQKAIQPVTQTKSHASILIVDDDEDTRRLITRFLEMQEYRVTASEDGIEALLYLGKEKFDLIISDINMPNLDGFKLLEMVSQKGIDIPVIFLTSRTSPEDEEKGLQMGAADYINKPIKKEILRLRVQRVLGKV
ncbi:MAG: ATPase, T2SS/T4P/T4SS family [Thermodesulfobacteriota bacterium]|nr:ATPase, T2SS/T4P/T4SS family [Thermodesulfobacteriota bacterium]